jgi:uncharacterized membrane protein
MNKFKLFLLSLLPFLLLGAEGESRALLPVLLSFIWIPIVIIIIILVIIADRRRRKKLKESLSAKTDQVVLKELL